MSLCVVSLFDCMCVPALHHAARTYNHPAVTVLVEAGAPIECKNKEVIARHTIHTLTPSLPHTPTPSQGKTPYDLAQECNYSYGMDVIHMWRQKRFPRGIIENVTRNPVSSSVAYSNAKD